MKYQMINEELQIASCSIADLTMEQVQSFLKQWEPGSSIGTLTLFYDRNNHVLVLNRDNEEYDLYKTLSEKYLMTNETGREKIAKEAPKGFEETIKVLDNCIKARTIGHEVDLALKNYVPGEHHRVLGEIYRRYDSFHNCLQIWCHGRKAHGTCQKKGRCFKC